MNSILRGALIVLYALGLAGAAGLLTGSFGTAMERLSAVILIIHVIETAALFKYVRLYKGPIAASIGLTLLFGLLHWKPLADAQAKAVAR